MYVVSDLRSVSLNRIATLLFLMQELLRHAETDVSRQSIYIATSVIDVTNIVESHYSIDIPIPVPILHFFVEPMKRRGCGDDFC